MFRPNIGSPIVVYEDDSDLPSAREAHAMAARAKYHIIILRKHRNDGGDRSIERVVHADSDGREYVFFDYSSWWVRRVYIQDGRDAGFYVSSGYREYHGTP